MIVTPALASIKLPESITPRSQGVHQSSIIRSIAIETGVLKQEFLDDVGLADVREIKDPVAVLRMCIGLAWEEFYIPQIPGVSKHPGEMCVNGIYMTPDGESIDVIITQRGGQGYGLRIHEVKATYKSTNTVGDLSKQWLWLTQMKGYCKGAKTRFAKLHVLFLCGDYKMPITPQLKCWDVEFTQAEIDANWELLTEYRDYKEGK